MRIISITVFTFLILFVSDIKAQKKKNPFSSANTKATSTRAGTLVSLGFGPRILDTNPGTITMSFTDDSPFNNRFQSTINVKDNYTRLAIQPALGFTHAWGLNHTIFSDITFLSRNRVFLFGYSLGWDIPLTTGSKRFIVRPTANAALGNVRFSLGRIQNTFGYIQIEDKVYSSNFLRVRLRQGIATYGPQLDFTYLLPLNIGVTLSVAYDFSQNINAPSVYFAPPLNENQSNGDDPNGTSIKLDDNNLDIEYNGNIIDQLPYQYGGLRITLSFMGYGSA